MKKWFIIVGGAFGLSILVMIGMLIYGAATLDTTAAFPKVIFTNISAFDFLEEYELDNINTYDYYLGEMQPKDSYVAQVEYRGRQYNIFAYEFGSAVEARQYFVNVSGASNTVTYPKCLFYLTSQNFIKSTYCAYYENCVYKVEGNGFARFCEFLTWLGEDFPINIRDEYYKEYGVWLVC